MPRLVERYWERDWGRPGGRRARQGFTYHAYVPSAIADLELTLPGDLATELGEAEAQLRALQGEHNMTGLEALSRQLLRAESIASSRIEGLTLSHRRLARALFDPGVADDTARNVLGNMAAMEQAISLTVERPITLDDLLEIHRLLLEHTQLSHIAGHVRTSQNWIGGNAYNPRGADFIPPPEDEVEPLLDDLCAFLEREDLPAIAQAALAHAQFETIHPFADGNGRVGRTLIHSVLRRRQLAPRCVPPISIVLATHGARYVTGLTNFRDGQPLEWLRFFARVVISAVEHSQELARRLAGLQQAWIEQAGHPRRDSAASTLITLLPSLPVLDVRRATEMVGVSDEAVRQAIRTLEEARILRPLDARGRRGQVWEAPEIIALLDTFEWDLATPTQPEQPRGQAPRRR